MKNIKELEDGIKDIINSTSLTVSARTPTSHELISEILATVRTLDANQRVLREEISSNNFYSIKEAFKRRPGIDASKIQWWGGGPGYPDTPKGDHDRPVG